MKRWLVLFAILASCSGCMLFDDLAYDAPSHVIYDAPPRNSCGTASGIITTSQTAEPPR